MCQLQCIAVLLMCGLLNASNPTVISSSSTPSALFDNDAISFHSAAESLISTPLTEDNFTSVFPIVCTSDGCVEGRATPGYQIDEYESFFGIPYAEAPVGKLRFAVSNECNQFASHSLYTSIPFFLFVCLFVRFCFSFSAKCIYVS